MAGHYFSEIPSTKSSRRSKLNFNFQGQFFTFWTSPGVFSPTQVDAGTRIFLEYAEIPHSGRILDLGVWVWCDWHRVIEPQCRESHKFDIY